MVFPLFFLFKGYVCHPYTKFGFICDTVTMWFFILPVASIAAFVLKWPVMVVFFLINLDEMIKLPVVFHHFRKYKWVKNIVS